MHQLNSLINLLDDPDQEAFGQVSTEILSLGLPAVEPLEEAWFSTNDELARQRIEEIVHSLQYENLFIRFLDWITSGAKDLSHGLMIANKFEYPNLDEEKVLDDLNKLTMDVWVELNDDLTSLEKIKVLNHVLFTQYQMNGEFNDIHVSDYFFLNNLLQSRHGNAVSIGILYILIAQRLKLPVTGVDLTGNFIACYTHLPSDFSDGYKPINDVKFYINPFAKGAVFTKKEILIYLEKAGIDPSENGFKPASNITILKRWCTDLMLAYQESGKSIKARELKLFIKVLNEKEQTG